MTALSHPFTGVFAHRFLASIAMCAALLTLVGCGGDAAKPASATSSTPAAEERNDGPTLKVATYNIRIGVGPQEKMESTDIKSNLAAIAAWITKNQLEIVMLQEVDVKTRRTGGYDEAAMLATMTGMNVQFAKAIEMGGGEYGIAILSRYPIRDPKIKQLFKPDYSVTAPNAPAWHSEQRVALAVTTDTPHGPVHVVCTHLGVTEDQRERQMLDLSDMVRTLPTSEPILLGGDFNAQPEEATFAPIRLIMKDCFVSAHHDTDPTALLTFSALKPERTIDYIFVNARLKPLSVEVPRIKLSDHMPVVATVMLRK